MLRLLRRNRSTKQAVCLNETSRLVQRFGLFDFGVWIVILSELFILQRADACRAAMLGL